MSKNCGIRGGENIVDGFENETMSQKSVHHETKEVTSRLREPLKFKIVPYKTQKEAGHIIQVELNVSWDQIDGMTNLDGAINQGILKSIELIEGPLQSKYLGATRPEV